MPTGSVVSAYRGCCHDVHLGTRGFKKQTTHERKELKRMNGKKANSPCIGCKFEHKDKNRDECGHCDARHKYACGQPAHTPVFKEKGKEPGVNKKKCDICGERKPESLEYFDQASRSGDGLTRACSICREKAKALPGTQADDDPKKAIKRCARCGEAVPATTEYFFKASRNSDGLSTRCKYCEYKRKRSKRHRREVVIDLAEYPGVWERLEGLATDQLRTIEAQAVWILMEAAK